MTCWFVSMEPSVPNLLRGRRVRRARVLHPLRTARNRPRATRCSFAPRGNDRGRGSRETRKRVKKEGSKVVSESRRRRRGARFRRVSRVGVVEPANRRRWMMRFFFFRASRFARSSAVSDCISLPISARSHDNHVAPPVHRKPSRARGIDPATLHRESRHDRRRRDVSRRIFITKNEKRKTTNEKRVSSRVVAPRFPSLRVVRDALPHAAMRFCVFCVTLHRLVSRGTRGFEGSDGNVRLAANMCRALFRQTQPYRSADRFVF